MKYFYFSIQHSFRMFLINEKFVFAEKRYPANICLFKVTIEALEKGVKLCQWRRSGVFIVIFEPISQLFLNFLLLLLNK